MKNRKFKFKIFTLAFLVFCFLSFVSVRAQISPQFLVSWQTQSYAPGWYTGKIFPTQGSSVEISFELIDSGKIVDLSATKVRWYVNDKLVQNEQNGLGLKYLKTIVPNYAGQEMEIRITIVDYKGQVLNNTIRIPVVKPEVVIDAPYPGNKVSFGSNFFEAIPFFFNIKNLGNLSFEWTFNNKKSEQPAEDPQIFNLNISSQIASGSVGNILVTVKNFLKELEFASKNLQITIK